MPCSRDVAWAEIVHHSMNSRKLSSLRLIEALNKGFCRYLVSGMTESID
jgi:hypothetical protein